MKKTPRWMIAVVAFLIPVFYVASFGPACWAYQHGHLSWRCLTEIYNPCLLAAIHGPRPVDQAFSFWANVCGGQKGLKIARVLMTISIDIEDDGAPTGGCGITYASP